MLEKVSVIIPIKNEKDYIEECLKRLITQTYPKEKMEILAIDGMSSDGTREIVKKLEAGGLIRLIDNPKGQRTSALNIGIKEAKGDVVIRIDARTLISPDYIEKCVKTLNETGADNVGGTQKPIIKSEEKGWRLEAAEREAGKNRLEEKDLPQTSNLKPRTLTQMAVGIALSHPFGVGNAQFRIGNKSGFVDTVYLGCFKKEIFDKVGLFDEESAVISEDSDINYRICKSGGRVYFNKDIVAYYYPRDNYKDLWKLYFRYGGAKAGNLLKRGSLTALRQFVPIIFLLSLIIMPILGFLNILFLYLAVGIVLFYLSIDLIISFFAVMKNDHKLSFKNKVLLFRGLIPVFPIIHFSWPMGFLRRLTQRLKPGEYWGY